MTEKAGGSDVGAPPRRLLCQRMLEAAGRLEAGTGACLQDLGCKRGLQLLAGEVPGNVPERPGCSYVCHPCSLSPRRLQGYKWFTSAADGEMSMALAREPPPDGTSSASNGSGGSGGLTLFYVPVQRDEEGKPKVRCGEEGTTISCAYQGCRQG